VSRRYLPEESLALVPGDDLDEEVMFVEWRRPSPSLPEPAPLACVGSSGCAFTPI
jgi:hypothetical protein